MALVKTDDTLPQSNPQSDVIRVMAVYTSWHQHFELCKDMLERLAEYTEALERGTLVFNVLQENAQPGVGPDISRARDLITTAEFENRQAYAHHQRSPLRRGIEQALRTQRLFQWRL
ncbi:hypothetical protein ABVK25_005603 [Lepraria finkii]|uniref:Uncharacterized protein n=1 Tax=Lepraria finkii TaxID=1340010 RepID=A0ABR4BB70_9LECA